MRKLVFAISVFLLAAFAQPAWSDAGSVNWVKVSDNTSLCLDAGECVFNVTASTATTALIRVTGAGASFTLGSDAITAGVTMTVWQKVHPTLATDATGQIFPGCSALASGYCIVTPGYYWIDFDGTEAVSATIRVTGIK